MKIESKILHQVIGPVIFTIFYFIEPLNGLNSLDMKILGILLWIAYWWITEPISIYMTALLPLVLIPTFTDISIKTIASGYSHPIVFLILGGFIFSIALQKAHLSERVALNLINLLGFSQKKIILSISLTVAFFSMWMSNSASTIVMLPIVNTILNIIHSSSEAAKENFAKCALLTLAYSASVGGIATIIGTPPNAVLVSQAYILGQREISLAEWMKIGVPVCVLGLVIINLLMPYIFKLKKESYSVEELKKEIKERIKNLGVLSYYEKWIICLFFIMVFFWIFKKSDWLNAILPIAKNITDTSVILFVSIILLMIRDKEKKYLLKWNQTMKEIDWGVLLLIGGGIALSAGLTKTNVINWIADFFSILDNFPILVTMILLALFTTFLTQVNSNTATSIILIPIFWVFAEKMNINPLMITTLIALASSTAFMLPVATVPNAIVFENKYIHIKDMIKAGLVLNIILPLLVSFLIYLKFKFIF